MTTRAVLETLTAGAYKRKFRWFDRCIYCGELATCLDHVFPVSQAVNLETYRLSVRKELGQGLNLVPSCQECNGIAGAKPFISIRKKREFIQKKLAKKYDRFNRTLVWEEEEIEELGYTLKTHILNEMKKAYLIKKRLAWPKQLDVDVWKGYIEKLK